MPQLQPPAELVRLAQAFAIGQRVVWYGGQLYRPVHFKTFEMNPTSKHETVWITIEDEELLAIAYGIDIIFDTDAQFKAWKFKVRQFARKQTAPVNNLLIRYGNRVMTMDEHGILVKATGKFTPNYLNVPYNPDSSKIDELWKILVEWTDGEDQARSLLHHLSTCLQPSWSASKYVLLIGSGKNGKSTLLKMTDALVGAQNISGVTRQEMASKSTAIVGLNGKLLNIVFDGPKEFLKDSSTEKTLVVGERISVKLLYDSIHTVVQTNALFIEGLQEEPMVADKSSALQKRLVRFYFPNTYEEDLAFEEKMLQPEMLAAFLHLLMKHWVHKSEKAEKLRLTARSLDLQTEAVKHGSPVLRYLEDLVDTDVKFLQSLLAGPVLRETFYTGFIPWLQKNNYKNTEKHILDQWMNDQFIMHVGSIPTGERNPATGKMKYTTKSHIKAVRPDALNEINRLLGIAAEEVSEVLEGD